MWRIHQTAIAASVVMALVAMAGAPASAQQGRVICVFNDSGAVLRARSHHDGGVTGWDRMASTQRACWYNLNGRVAIQIDYLNLATWDRVCTRIAEAGASRTVRVTGTVWNLNCQ